MKLLVACPRKLLLVDSESGKTQVVEQDRPEYYGISWSEEGRQLCLGHSGVENSSLGSLESYMDSERGWLSLGSRRGPDSLSAAHQILCAGDRVIATNTGRNCLTVFRTDDWFYRHYWIDDIRWDRKGQEDRCGSHLNSIFLRDDVLYVVAHNHDRGSAVVRLAWPEMTVLGIETTSTLMAHNVWVTEQGQMLVCDSMRRTLMDVTSNEVVWQCELPKVVTRGLAATNEYIFVGHSAIGPREERVNRDSRIWIVEPGSWKTLGSLHLQGAGNVHEIRILDEPDLCHHGHVFRGQITPAKPPQDSDLRPSHQLKVVRPSSEDQSDGPTRHARWQQHVPFVSLSDHRATAADFSLATLTQLNAADVVVRARVDLSAAAARHAGLVARYQGPDDKNMLVALVAKADAGFRAQVWQQRGTAWSCLTTGKLTHGQGMLALQTIGNEAFVSFDGQPLIRCRIPGPVQAGRVGLRSAGATFDQFAAHAGAEAGGILQRKSA